MSYPVGFEIDTAGYSCQRHGDIGGRVFSLTIRDADKTATTGPVCLECLANMLSCCRAEVKKEESDDR
jgi:hypothetical protein